MSDSETKPIYGLLAEFETPEAVLAASEAVHAAGYREIDAYTPFPIHGLDVAIGFPRQRLPLIVLLGGLFGAVAGFGMQYFAAVIHYPMNVGGRPMNSWPSFIPIAFETTILFAALSAVFGMLALNRLPLPYHPVFNVPEFKRASQDRFYLCIKTSDPNFDDTATRALLTAQNPDAIYDVEP